MPALEMSFESSTAPFTVRLVPESKSLASLWHRVER